jgi:hypothetical protein
MTRKRLGAVIAALAILGSLGAIYPSGVAASCHLGGYTETQATNTFRTAIAGNTTTATSRVRWRYLYDCSWDIIAVEIDWRRITLTIKGPDTYLCCYPRDLISFHVISRYNATDTAYPAFASCAHENCTFGPWTDNGNVNLSYSPAAFNAQYSPHTRMSCVRCDPVGVNDMAQDYWFVHGRSELDTVAG